MIFCTSTLCRRSAIDIHEEEDGFAAAGVDDRVGHVGAVVGGVAGFEDFRVAGGLNADLALLDGEEFAGAFEMGRAAERPAGLELDLVEFHVLFEVQRRERADAAVFVGTIMIGVVVGSDHGDR